MSNPVTLGGTIHTYGQRDIICERSHRLSGGSVDSKRGDDGRLPQTARHAVEPGGEVVCGGHWTRTADGSTSDRLQQRFPRNERERDEPVRVLRCGRQDWNVHLQDTGRPELSDLARPLAHHRGVHSRPQAVQRPLMPARRATTATPTQYCALFIPNCQAGTWGGASAGHQGGANQGCKV